jgi:HlyD family secretion protein
MTEPSSVGAKSGLEHPGAILADTGVTDASLPVVRPSISQPVPYESSAARRRWPRLVVLALIIALSAAGGGYWWLHRVAPLPPGIATGNGRLEADPIDIATKFPGRIFQLFVDEGEMVTAGQVVAFMDTRDLEANLKKSEAQVERAQKSINEARANVDQLHSQVVLAGQEFDRSQTLLKNGWTTREVLEQRQQQLDSARAAEVAALARVAVAEHALHAAEHDVELSKVNIADNTLIAPRDGRIEYRIANVGEVLPAGGKVFTMIDVSYVYMDIYLPTLIAGRIKIGDDARILLDAYPDRPIPAKVTFIAAQAQFTPKMVETQTERDKLMFRIRVRIDPDLLHLHAEAVRSGLPGVGFVRFDPKTGWPEHLQGKP